MFLQDPTGEKKHLKARAEHPIIYIQIYYLCFNAACKFRGTLMCKEVLKKKEGIRLLADESYT